MRKLIKKSILNGLIRTFVSIFYTVFTKLKSFKNEEKSVPKNDSKIKYLDANSTSEDEDQDLANTDSNLTDYDSFKEDFIIEAKQCNSSLYYEYINETGQVYKLSPSLLKQQNSVDVKSTKSPKRYFRFRAIFVFIFIVIAYVSLNNYLIMFIYYKSNSSAHSSSSSALLSKSKHSSIEYSLFLPLASFFKNRYNRKLNQNLKDNNNDNINYDSNNNKKIKNILNH